MHRLNLALITNSLKCYYYIVIQLQREQRQYMHAPVNSLLHCPAVELHLNGTTHKRKGLARVGVIIN